MTAITFLLTGLLYGSAFAQDATQPDDVEPPPPVVKLERVPPRASYELGVQMGFASMPQFDNDVATWPGFGARFQWGKNIALHRVGVGTSVSLEGPAPKYYSIAVEPNVAWDFVSNSGFAMGASLGPSVLLNSQLTYVASDWWLTFAPTAAIRLGWSQSWSRMGRRVHFYVEPKVRVMKSGLAPAAAVVIGSGRGK